MKKFLNPKMEISRFDMENVVTTSSIDGIALTKAALNSAGITSIEEKSLGSFDIINAE